MDLLGRLVELFSGLSFGQFLEEHIFEPLGMTNTGFNVPDDKIERFACNYNLDPEGDLLLAEDPLTAYSVCNRHI